MLEGYNRYAGLGLRDCRFVVQRHWQLEIFGLSCDHATGGVAVCEYVFRKYTICHASCDRGIC